MEFHLHLVVKLADGAVEMDRETKSIVQRPYMTYRSFKHLISFSVLFNMLEPIKALATKLQNRNQNFYQAFKIADNIIHDLEDTREEIDKEFATWFEFAKEISKYVSVNPPTPRNVKC